jgi:hypothetical protein
MIPTKSGYFDDFTPISHVYDLKAATYCSRTAEAKFDLLRRGICGHVKVLGLPAQQQISYGTTDDVSVEAVFLQSTDDMVGARRKVIGAKALTGQGVTHNSLIRLMAQLQDCPEAKPCEVLSGLSRSGVSVVPDVRDD